MPLSGKIDRRRRKKGSPSASTDHKEDEDVSLSFPDDDSFEPTVEVHAPGTPKRRSYGGKNKEKTASSTKKSKPESPEKKKKQRQQEDQKDESQSESDDPHHDEDLSSGDEIIDPDDDDDDESYGAPAPILSADDDSDHSSLLDDASEQPSIQRSRFRAESNLADENDGQMLPPPPRTRITDWPPPAEQENEGNGDDEDFTVEDKDDEENDEDHIDGDDEKESPTRGSRKSTRRHSKRGATEAEQKETRSRPRRLSKNSNPIIDLPSDEEEDFDGPEEMPPRKQKKTVRPKPLVDDDGDSANDGDDDSDEQSVADVRQEPTEEESPTRPKRATKTKGIITLADYVDDDDDDEFAVEESDDKDDDDDDFEAEEKTTSKKNQAKNQKKPTKESGAKKKRRNINSDDDSDSDEVVGSDESDSDDEDFGASKKKTKSNRKKASGKKKPIKSRRKVVKNDSGEESEEEERQPTGRGRKVKAQQERKSKRSASRNKPNYRQTDLYDFVANSNDDEQSPEKLEEEASSNDEKVPTRGARRSRRKKPRKNMRDYDEDGQISGEDAPPSPRSNRTLRKRPRKNLREDSNSDIDAMIEAFGQSDPKADSSSSTVRRAKVDRGKKSKNETKNASKSATKNLNEILDAIDEEGSGEDREDSEEEADDPPRSRGRSVRKSAFKASKKFAALRDEDNSDDSDDQSIPKKPAKSIGNRNNTDDQDFDIDENADASDSSDENEEIDDDDESFAAEAGNVDVDDTFLDADESSDDGMPKTARTPPSLKIMRSSSRRQRAEPEEEERWDTESNEDADNGTDDEIDLLPRVLATPHMPYCMSTNDTITLDQLPSKHICFYTPDGKSKQCFALETLHKIALTGNVMNSNNKPTFKQPPHFRAPISDDLLDQIASRFGRAAVDPTGPFYNPKAQSSDSESSPLRRTEFDYIVNFEGNLMDDEVFFDKYNRYVSSYMGSRDIYCCPICYTEAHRRLETDEFEQPADDSDNEDETKVTNLEFTADPITVVGCVDEDTFKLASAFCFSLLKQVKDHLRKHHQVDPSKIEGNDLYKRFQIRASDGLLQRYLEQRKSKNRTSRHGEMMGYWFEGNNEMFVYLLHLMDRRQLVAEKLSEADSDDEDETLKDAREFEAKFTDFWSSFANRAKRLWNALSSPYLKASKEELAEFLDDEDEDEGEDIQYHLVKLKREVDPTPEEAILATLREKRGKGMEDDSSSEDENEEEEEEDEDVYKEEEEDELESSDYENNDSRYYSEEEEEDEWIQKVKSKGKARIRNKGRRNNTKVVDVPIAKKLGGRKRRVSNVHAGSGSEASSSQADSSKKRRVIEESDSDYDE